MPIGVNQYPTLSPEQANGYQYGLMQAIERQLKASQSRNYNAAAAEQEAKNPYVGQRELEALLMDQQKNKWYAPNIQSEIGLRGAQTNLANVNAQFTPLDSYSKAAAALRTSSRQERATDWIRAVELLPVKDRGNYLAQHAAEYQQAIADLSGNNTASGGAPQNPMEQALMNEVQKQSGYSAPSTSGGRMPMPTQQQSMQPNQMLNSNPNVEANLSPARNIENAVMNTLPPEDRPPSNDPDIKAAQDKLNQARFSATPDQAKQLADYGTMNSIRGLNTQYQNGRADGAKVLELFLRDMRTPDNIARIQSAAKEAGNLSKWERHVQSLLPASMQSQSYKDLLWFEDTFQNGVTNTVKQMEKLNGDKTSIARLEQLSKILYDSRLGSKDALKTFNESIRTLQKMSDSVFDASEPKYAKGIYKRMYGLPSEYDNYIPGESTKTNEPSLADNKAELARLLNESK